MLDLLIAIIATFLLGVGLSVFYGLLKKVSWKASLVAMALSALFVMSALVRGWGEVVLRASRADPFLWIAMTISMAVGITVGIELMDTFYAELLGEKTHPH